MQKKRLLACKTVEEKVALFQSLKKTKLLTEKLEALGEQFLGTTKLQDTLKVLEELKESLLATYPAEDKESLRAAMQATIDRIKKRNGLQAQVLAGTHQQTGIEVFKLVEKETKRERESEKQVELEINQMLYSGKKPGPYEPKMEWERSDLFSGSVDTVIDRLLKRFYPIYQLQQLTELQPWKEVSSKAEDFANCFSNRSVTVSLKRDTTRATFFPSPVATAR